MNNISVIGSGTMGNGIAHVFAQHGFKVSMVDISPDSLTKALQTITLNLDRQVKKGFIDEKIKKTTLNNISTFTSIKEGVLNSDLVIEAVTENPEAKLKIFKELDEYTPSIAILASNTSSISITKIASATKRPGKVIGMHFMNPVPLMKLIEVIKGKSTSVETTEMVMNLSKKIEKIPVEINDYPGFVANRILMPMINEAIYVLYEKIAGVEEIDTVMKTGMSHPMGPLQLADFIGLDVCLFIMNVLHDGLKNPKYAPCPLLINMVESGNKGIKNGEGFYKYAAESKELVVADRFRVQSN